MPMNTASRRAHLAYGTARDVQGQHHAVAQGPPHRVRAHLQQRLVVRTAGRDQHVVDRVGQAREELGERPGIVGIERGDAPPPTLRDASSSRPIPPVRMTSAPSTRCSPGRREPDPTAAADTPPSARPVGVVEQDEEDHSFQREPCTARDLARRGWGSGRRPRARAVGGPLPLPARRRGGRSDPWPAS